MPILMPRKVCLMSKVQPNCIGQSKEVNQSEVTINDWAETGAKQCIGIMTETRVHSVGRDATTRAQARSIPG